MIFQALILTIKKIQRMLFTNALMDMVMGLFLHMMLINRFMRKPVKMSLGNITPQLNTGPTSCIPMKPRSLMVLASDKMSFRIVKLSLPIHGQQRDRTGVKMLYQESVIIKLCKLLM